MGAPQGRGQIPLRTPCRRVCGHGGPLLPGASSLPQSCEGATVRASPALLTTPGGCQHHREMFPGGGEGTQADLAAGRLRHRARSGSLCLPLGDEGREKTQATCPGSFLGRGRVGAARTPASEPGLLVLTPCRTRHLPRDAYQQLRHPAQPWICRPHSPDPGA